MAISKYPGMYPAKRNKGWFLLPGSNYIGPGNTLDGAPPTNKVDYAAYKHDTDSRFRYFKHNRADEDFIRRVERVKPSTYVERFHKTAALGWHYFKRSTFPHEADVKNYIGGAVRKYLKEDRKTPRDPWYVDPNIPNKYRKKFHVTDLPAPKEVDMPYVRRRATRTRVRRPLRRLRRTRIKRRVYRRKVKKPARRYRKKSYRRYKRKRMPVIMNQEVGLKYKKMKPFIPKVAATVVSNFWARACYLTSTPAYDPGKETIQGDIFSDVGTYVRGFHYDITDGILKDYNNNYATSDRTHDTSTTRRKYCQLFKCGQLNSVMAKPLVVERVINPTGPVTERTVANLTNPFLNVFDLNQKPGYPHELMSRLYDKVRVSANKYTITMSLVSRANKMRDVYGRFYVQYGIYWVKPASRDPRTASQQFGQDVMNKSMEQLRIQPGVVTKRLTGRKQTLKVFIPSEKLANKRLNEKWKFGVEDDVSPTSFTYDTQPIYDSFITNDSGQNVFVPYYNTSRPWGETTYPYFWIIVHDLGTLVSESRRSFDTNAVMTYQDDVVVKATFKEKRYQIFSDPKFVQRTQAWSEGSSTLDGSGVYRPLPERARISNYMTVNNSNDLINMQTADKTMNTIVNYTPADVADLIINNNTSNMEVNVRSLANLI